jgi:3-dehydroquinate synthase
MDHARQIRVSAASKHYSAICGEGALGIARRDLTRIAAGARCFVLSSPTVWKHCGAEVRKALRSAGAAAPILFDDREAAKSLATVERLCRALARAGADRRCVIIAVGGGVIGDVAGFVAATYLRGVKLIQVPTTLVAQVDSAIGGKTGVNLPEGKNLVGAFYQPDLVIADQRLLRTLPAREFRSGLYEVIKYAAIGDAKLFRTLEENLERILARDSAILADVIARCVAMKARITAMDERESGPREILNFGHTYGHAIETLSKYRGFLHGEAVGWGMIAAVFLGLASGHLLLPDGARIIRLIRRVGPLPILPKASAKDLLATMRGDKKSRGGQIRFVLARGVGRVERGVELPDDLVTAVWRELSTLPTAAKASSLS